MIKDAVKVVKKYETEYKEAVNIGLAGSRMLLDMVRLSGEKDVADQLEAAIHSALRVFATYRQTSNLPYLVGHNSLGYDGPALKIENRID